jgi:hypothetical protein
MTEASIIQASQEGVCIPSYFRLGALRGPPFHLENLGTPLTCPWRPLSRLAVQSERLGSELARHLGVPTPQARVIHSGSEEWAAIQAAVEKAKVSCVAAPHLTAS